MANTAAEFEADLVQRAREGDGAAFALLYHASRKEVLLVVRRIIRDEDTAEQLTNEAFARAWEKLGAFRGDSAFSTWAVRIGINQARMHLRREKSTQQFLPADAGGPDAASVASALDDFGSVEDREVLNMAFAKVPFAHRELLRMRFLEDLDVQDIVLRTGRSRGAVKCGLQRATKGLRKSIRDLSAVGGAGR